MSLLAELKRRNVIRMAGLYLVGAWLLVQVAGTVLPIFHTPGWALQALVTLVVIGFVPMLVFAWVFELTPEGIKRDAEVDPAQSIAPKTALRMNRMIVALLALALVYFGVDKFVLAPRRDAALVATTQAATTRAASHANTDADRKSIAVLPFVNMSGDKDNEYFSDGISEEILNVLARTPDLHVAARTSSFAFKGKTQEVPAIARELNVRMVLEGSVRKQNDRVRITAQLIDAKTGYHVWSQTYDRQLQDIFAIQDEIARAIGAELAVKLADVRQAGTSSVGTRNIKAYDLYLRGIALWHTRKGEALWQAIGLFEQATAADPKFASGYAGEALVYAVLRGYSNRIPGVESMARARDFAERALALDPSLPEPYAALGSVAKTERRWDAAGALFDRAIVLRPSFATGYQWRGTLMLATGDLAAGLADLERASKLDPRSLVVAENHAYVLSTLGRTAEANARCTQALAFAPDYGPCLSDMAFSDMQSGDLAGARMLFAKLAAVAKPGAGSLDREILEALASHGDRHAVATRLAALPSDGNLDPASVTRLEDYQIPGTLILLGENQLALDFFEKIAGEIGGNIAWVAAHPAVDPIRCEPRFKAVMQRLRLTDPHATKVCAGRG